MQRLSACKHPNEPADCTVRFPSCQMVDRVTSSVAPAKRPYSWAPAPGCILVAVGLCLDLWPPWHPIRSAIMAGDAAKYAGALALLVVAAWTLVRATRTRSTG